MFIGHVVVDLRVESEVRKVALGALAVGALLYGFGRIVRRALPTEPFEPGLG